MTQSSGKSAEQMAKDDVQNNYPDVYRADEDLRNHAFALAQQQLQSPSGQTSGEFAVQVFAEAYMAAYNQAVQDRDAQR